MKVRPPSLPFPNWTPAFAGGVWLWEQDTGCLVPDFQDRGLAYPINRATSSKLSASALTPIAFSRAPCSALQCDPADKPMT